MEKREKELIKKISRLESVNDQLTAELRAIDSLAKKLGFSNGLQTLKSAAIELIDIQDNEDYSEEDEDVS